VVDLIPLAEIIALGFPPAVIYLWFFYKRDKWEPEPFKLVLTVFLFGFIACELAGFFNTANQIAFLGGSNYLTGAISAPIVEESLKWGVVFFAVYSLKEFNEPLDGFVYGAAAGLGFAAFENVGYMFQAWIAGGTDNLLLSAAERGVFMATGHPVFTGTSCFFLGVAKFMPKGKRRYAVALGGLVLAMGLHATWNGVINGVVVSNAGSLGNNAFYLAAITFMGLALLLVSTYTNIGLNRSPFNPTRWTPLPSAVLGARIGKAASSAGAARPSPLRFCPRCGAPLAAVARFCAKCGTQISTEAG
jgi:RsiW-degrading membrane proteinase PrsW (M82 family)